MHKLHIHVCNIFIFNGLDKIPLNFQKNLITIEFTFKDIGIVLAPEKFILTSSILNLCLKQTSM